MLYLNSNALVFAGKFYSDIKLNVCFFMNYFNWIFSQKRALFILNSTLNMHFEGCCRLQNSRIFDEAIYL
ncbi:MAG: hypothetical protein S4CHLAM37_15990 [Chlamydiia bacterium]|nr:hypothetical protein [Chlamydiia bacterium]